MVHSGADYFCCLEEIINAAKSEIHLQTYSFEDDETGHKIANALIAAAKRGVQVYMVLDAYGSKDISPHFIKNITASGIKFRFFGMLGKKGNFAWGRRLHHKIVVVDGYISLVGGINIANRYLGYGFNDAWLDFALLIKGNVGQHIAKVCRHTFVKWFRKNKGNTPAIKAHEQINIQLLQNDWLRSKNQIAQSYAKAIKAAQKEIIIANSYFLPGGYFRRLLKDASQRGVKVKIFLPSISDVPMAKNAISYLYRYLLRNNIEIYEWMPSVLHAKIACIDGRWSTIGSYNLNYLSAYASIEFNISVLDKDFSTLFQQHLHTLLNSNSVPIQKEKFIQKLTPLRLFVYWFSFKIMKLSEVLLISFPGQHFLKRNKYA